MSFFKILQFPTRAGSAFHEQWYFGASRQVKTSGTFYETDCGENTRKVTFFKLGVVNYLPLDCCPFSLLPFKFVTTI